MKLKIIAPGKTTPFPGTKIFLDGQEITGVTAVNIALAVGSANRVTISMVPSEIEIDSEPEAEVEEEENQKCC